MRRVFSFLMIGVITFAAGAVLAERDYQQEALTIAKRITHFKDLFNAESDRVLDVFLRIEPIMSLATEADLMYKIKICRRALGDMTILRDLNMAEFYILKKTWENSGGTIDLQLHSLMMPEEEAMKRHEALRVVADGLKELGDKCAAAQEETELESILKSADFSDMKLAMGFYKVKFSRATEGLIWVMCDRQSQDDLPLFGISIILPQQGNFETKIRIAEETERIRESVK